MMILADDLTAAVDELAAADCPLMVHVSLRSLGTPIAGMQKISRESLAAWLAHSHELDASGDGAFSVTLSTSGANS
jgi:hypothetical protein